MRTVTKQKFYKQKKQKQKNNNKRKKSKSFTRKKKGLLQKQKQCFVFVLVRLTKGFFLSPCLSLLSSPKDKKRGGEHYYGL